MLSVNTKWLGMKYNRKIKERDNGRRTKKTGDTELNDDSMRMQSTRCGSMIQRPRYKHKCGHTNTNNCSSFTQRTFYQSRSFFFSWTAVRPQIALSKIRPLFHQAACSKWDVGIGYVSEWYLQGFDFLVFYKHKQVSRLTLNMSFITLTSTVL